jgi:hypothetical protein
VFALILFSVTAAAYTKEDGEEMCKKPQFRDFSLPEYQEPEKHEVAPESEFTVMLSPWADPKTIKLSAKKQPLEFSVESNSSFHRIKAKLPAELTGKYVRIDTSVKAALGCTEKDGWLIKVADQ